MVKLIENTDAFMPADVRTLYEEAFPVEERREWSPRPAGLKLYVALDDADEFQGFITTWLLPGDVTYVEHFAIHPKLRGHGVGGEIIDALLGNVILEVELPETQEARRRIGFYERHGFAAATECEYVQPPYAPGLPSVPMLLMCRGNIDAEKTAHLLHTIVYGCE